MATCPKLSLLITCEHASHYIPEYWQPAFAGQEALLASHEGWDPGALELAAAIQRATLAPMIRGDVSRLLIELNRSEDHPQLFSRVSSTFTVDEKRLLMERFYRPYRQSVHSAVDHLIQSGKRVVHLSVHSFTPVWQGKEREVDIGVLFDPERSPERELALQLHNNLLSNTSPLRIVDNEPYKGTDDGLTTSLRGCFPAYDYSGIEIEVSQRFPAGDAESWRVLMAAISASVHQVQGQ